MSRCSTSARSPWPASRQNGGAAFHGGAKTSLHLASFSAAVEGGATIQIDESMNARTVGIS